MQNIEKINQIKILVNRLNIQNNHYKDNGIYFDYDSVICKLSEALEILEDTIRCPRPEGIPEDIPWCERMDTEEINPYEYDGSMSVEDFRKVQELIL